MKMHKMSTVNRTKWSRSIKAQERVKVCRAENEKERKRRIQEEKDDEQKIVTEKPKGEYKEDGSQTSVMFACMRCKSAIPSSRKAFRIDTLDSTVWCGRCRKSWMAKAYLCPCDVAWFKCHLHANSKGNPTDGANQQGKGAVVGGENAQPVKKAKRQRSC